MREKIFIYGNEISKKVVRKAIKNRNMLIKKYKYNEKERYDLTLRDNNILKKFFIIKDIVIGRDGENFDIDKGIIISSIRMGYGHYRASLALASAAYSKGFIPYWLDLLSFDTPGAKIINHLNYLYSLGSRLSQIIPIFNKLYWEPLTSITMKKLDYNAVDRKMCELFSNIFYSIPNEIPVLSTHSWPAQAAIYAGLKNVINVVLDNLPLALHFAEGALNTVQCLSSYLGYRILKDMHNYKSEIKNIPSSEFFVVGHYIDHEIVSNIENDCNLRMKRIKNNEPKRFLLSIGGAGAQKNIFLSIIQNLLELIKSDKVTLLINLGDHFNVFDFLSKNIHNFNSISKVHNNWDEIIEFFNNSFNNIIRGINVFMNKNIFSAIYTTNLLMRISDVLITKPSELTYYPVPKLFIQRVGGHEAYNAIHSSEIGDGTFECERIEQVFQVLDLLINESDLLNLYIENIKKLNQIGIYDGAYKVIDLAKKIKNK